VQLRNPQLEMTPPVRPAHPRRYPCPSQTTRRWQRCSLCAEYAAPSRFTETGRCNQNLGCALQIFYSVPHSFAPRSSLLCLLLPRFAPPFPAN